MADAAPNENANDKAHEKNKTKEIKEHREKMDAKAKIFQKQLDKIMALEDEIIESADSNLKNNPQTKLDRENEKFDRMIEKHDNEYDFPPAQINKLIEQQEQFESKVNDLNLQEFIVSAGINGLTKEIQVGLDSETVNSTNESEVIAMIDNIMPKSAKWHVIYSSRAQLDSCNQQICDPLIGGNLIKIVGVGNCSMGFQAHYGGISGLVTAGHCFDGDIGKTVNDADGDFIGTTHAESVTWGNTYCDCGFISASYSETDNKVYRSSSTQYTLESYVSSTDQPNDLIYKSGKTSGVTIGFVENINQSNWVGLTVYKNVVSSNASHQGGDSGGTVFNGSTLYGIIQGHNSDTYFHMPIDKIISVFGAAPVLG